MMGESSPATKKGIHLVAPGKAQSHPSTRLTLGDFIADIVLSKGNRPCCHYMIQRVGSAEIIDMQQFDAFEEAERAAKEALQMWHRRDQDRAG